jgi:hypothetical protein
MDIKKINHLFQREFEVSETLQVLTHNKTIYWSWGVNELLNCNNKGLLMKVNGHHHKDYVLVTLGWDDTYNIYFLDNDMNIPNENEKIEGIYFDQLVEVIDNRIERVNEYVY